MFQERTGAMEQTSLRNTDAGYWPILTLLHSFRRIVMFVLGTLGLLL